MELEESERPEERDIAEVRAIVAEASRRPLRSDDADYDALAARSLIAAFNRLAPSDMALPAAEDRGA